MKKKILLVLSFLLCAAPCLSACQGADSTGGSPSSDAASPSSSAASSAGGTQGDNTPGYLNLASNGLDGPIVKDGQTVKVKVAVSRDATQGDADQIWLWEYFRQAHNIDAQVEQVMDAAEYKNLTFASGDLPDAIINMGVTTQDIMNYGAEEGMFLRVDEYLDPYMPNLSKIYAEHPEYKDMITAPDSHIYGLGMISDPNDISRNNGYFINCKMREALGLSKPETLDEFVDMLRAFKAADPNCIPFNGGFSAYNPCLILLNAYGWCTTDATGKTVALRGGNVVFPYGDREAYGAYLKTMNALYRENLMSHDFYTLKNADVQANVAQGLAGTYTSAPWSASPDVFMDWDTPEPLTSDYNQTKFWPVRTTPFDCGKWVISADTEYPELMCKWADFWYNETGMALACYGPLAGSDIDTYGMTSGWEWNEETNWIVYDDILNDTQDLYGGMENIYRKKKIMIFTGVSFGDMRDFFGATAEIAGIDYQKNWSLDSLDFRHYVTMQESQAPYYVTPYPGNTFFSPEINKNITDLKSVIDSYVDSESAKFITGARPLTDEELTAYFDGLDKLGYPEYLQYYIDYYAEYTSKH